MADAKDKIKAGLAQAVAHARRDDEDGPETVYRVRNRPGRVAVSNQTTKQTTIYPMPAKAKQ